jgi:hypothetical protein
MIRRHLSAYLSCFAAGLSLVLLLSVAIAPASAGSVMISVSGFNPADPNTRMDASREVQISADDTFNYYGGFGDDNTLWQMEINSLTGDLDPFTDLNFTMKNNSAVTLQYLVSIGLPTGPLGPSTVHGGSVVGGATDANAAGGVTLATVAGKPFFAGQIDGATVLPIYPDPTIWSAAFGSVGIPAMSPGLPGPTLPSGPVVASIGIVHEFTLTPGDTMSATSFFQVEAIPEPAACMLALYGLFATCALRRRA